MILKAALSLTWICQEDVCYIPGLHSWATKFRTSTAAGHCWMNSSQNELSSNSWAITRHALNRKIIHLKCYKVCAEFKAGFTVVNSRVILTLILAGPSPKAAFPCFINGFIEDLLKRLLRVLQGHSWSNGSKEEFLQSLAARPQRKGTELVQSPLRCLCTKPGLTWFLFQQGAAPLPLLGLSHLLLQEVRCE